MADCGGMTLQTVLVRITDVSLYFRSLSQVVLLVFPHHIPLIPGFSVGYPAIPPHTGRSLHFPHIIHIQWFLCAYI